MRVAGRHNVRDPAQKAVGRGRTGINFEDVAALEVGNLGIGIGIRPEGEKASNGVVVSEVVRGSGRQHGCRRIDAEVLLRHGFASRSSSPDRGLG